MKNRELVLIGDVIKSRKKFDPEEWRYFHDTTEQINEKFKLYFKIPLTIYSGDSFGGVCMDIGSAVKIILAIQEYQRHQKSRTVLIEDEIAFGMNEKNFLSLEGPALWRGQEQIELLKKRTALFSADLKDHLMTATINTILNLILAIRDEWKAIEWEIYRHRETDLTQKDLAEKTGVSQQYISKLTKSSKLELVLEAEKNLNTILDGILHKQH
ncbi:SatD family protein [Echinicola shivajiensis]|uniref:SatD family protein n=1 Tax=Echinicola shivajiensis TaxID=1035916 RepID=UPI001BFC7604|nr:SatD family protein [Echinicola shivajiensis]